ncbi:hypothetical protein Micbo1qcDRAFT_207169 [Microdochium bolleyi]|uniref:Uncharacterized protein n=1 Tax=Microdochium bolleyi TaxID=196109 RepID=A0A136IUC2_9PEZI|nr:hypothetical protein Micbo1qcDRAFT_207169 [Microdochium bolleyi]
MPYNAREISKPALVKPKKAAGSGISSDVITIAVEKADAESILCDPRLGGCGNIRPLVCFTTSEISASSSTVAADATAHSSAATTTTVAVPKKALCAYCVGVNAANSDEINALLNPEEGEDMVYCRSVHHPEDSQREMDSAHFRQREPRVKNAHGPEHFRIRRAVACNECCDKEIDVVIAAAAAKSATTEQPDGASSINSADLPVGASAATLRREKKKGRNASGSAAATSTAAIPATTRVLPIIYYPQNTSPHARLDHIRSDYFALPVNGKKKWWNAAVEGSLQQLPGSFEPTADEAARIAAIIDGEDAECPTCGERKKVEREFPVKIWVTDGAVQVQHGDECLGCDAEESWPEKA